MSIRRDSTTEEARFFREARLRLTEPEFRLTGGAFVSRSGVRLTARLTLSESHLALGEGSPSAR